MTVGGTLLRWVLAPVGATVALVSGVAVAALIGLIFFDRAELSDRSSVPATVVGAVAVTLAAMAWVLAGSSIPPVRHRRVAFALFFGPLILLTLVFVIQFALGRLQPRQLYLGVGLVMACAGLMLLLSVRWLWSRALERRREIERIADVFADEPIEK
jgi:hypothetical protein